MLSAPAAAAGLLRDRAGVERQAADGHFRQTVLEADHLALLGDAQAAFEASRRLRQQRCVCRRAATANRATASVEQGQLNTSFLAGFDQCVLRLILRQDAAITPASFAESE